MNQTTYRIYDSTDRPMGRARSTPAELYLELSLIEAEAEATDDKRTFAIGQIGSDGEVTFDFG